jgi:hypothetical protein
MSRVVTRVIEIDLLEWVVQFEQIVSTYFKDEE